MPELPEVELAARRLHESLVGRPISSVTVVDPKLLTDGNTGEWEAALVGRTVQSAERRAKYLLLPLDSPHTLVIHLRMTGRFVVDCFASRLAIQDRVDSSTTTPGGSAAAAARTAAAPGPVRK